jgi:hypothetical protein
MLVFITQKSFFLTTNNFNFFNNVLSRSVRTVFQRKINFQNGNDVSPTTFMEEHAFLKANRQKRCLTV